MPEFDKIVLVMRKTSLEELAERHGTRGQAEFLLKKRGNTFRDIEHIYRSLGEGHGVKFEHECYDVGHLYNLAHCVDRGLFKPPMFLQIIFGILGGISTGQDIIVNVAVKPTSSIRLTRHTIDKQGNATTIETHGRHDPCVGIRATPICEAMLVIRRLAKSSSTSTDRLKNSITPYGLSFPLSGIP